MGFHLRKQEVEFYRQLIPPLELPWTVYCMNGFWKKLGQLGKLSIYLSIGQQTKCCGGNLVD